MATTTTKASRAIADEVLGHLGRIRKTRIWLSEETGIPNSTLNRRLNADSPFTIDELVIVAEAVGVPLAAIVRPIATPTAPAVADPAVAA